MMKKVKLSNISTVERQNFVNSALSKGMIAENLDYVKTNGFYQTGLYTTSLPLNTVGGSLFVFSDGAVNARCVQVHFSNDSVTSVHVRRVTASSAWSEWVKLT